MFSKRIKAIASLIEKNDIVLDVGCDHGYLDIYLVENDLCKCVFASDISINALNAARNNFKKRNLSIETFLSDGFKNIPVDFNTAVISGMGTSNILEILNYDKLPDKLIISSHNDLYKLRKSLNKLGYRIMKEKCLLDGNHYYNIILCIKGIQVLTEYELRFGISNNKEYFKYLYDKNKLLIKCVPFRKKIKLILENRELKKIIGRK